MTTIVVVLLLRSPLLFHAHNVHSEFASRELDEVRRVSIKVLFLKMLDVLLSE